MSEWLSVKTKSTYTGSLILLGLASLALTGCANFMAAGFYDPPKASSATDANAIATNAYATQSVQAPAQFQIDLRQPTAEKPAATATTTQAATVSAPQVYKAPQNERDAVATVAVSSTVLNDAPPPESNSSDKNTQAVIATPASPQSEVVPEPTSFSGTVPCFNPNMGCNAQKVVLSLAPNGRWRSRTTFLDQEKQAGKPMTEQGCWRTLLSSPIRIAILSSTNTERAQFALPSDNLLRVISVDGQTPNLNYSLSRQPDLDPIKELDKATAPSCN